MEGVLLSSSLMSRCVLRRVPPTPQSKCVFEETNKKFKSIIISSNPKTKGTILLQRVVVAAVSGNTQPQAEEDDDDDDDDDDEEEEEEDDDEEEEEEDDDDDDDDDDDEEEEEEETKPIAEELALSGNVEDNGDQETKPIAEELALSGNVEDNGDQETKPLAEELALSGNVEDNGDQETKPLAAAAAAVASTPTLDHSSTTQSHTSSPTTNSSQYGTGSPRAGLFRTPISGGVQTATSIHGLPPPALAVRNLMEQARFAHLCTVMSRMHHRREGYPFGSLVDFATDAIGHPIFSFSPLAIHTRNLLADPRCTLVVQIPGWSGLSNARVTIFGDVFPLPEDQQEWAHKQYIAKHQQGPSQKWGNFYYFRMQNISDIYFIGGFGTVAWVNVSEYEALRPDKIAVDGGEQNLKELNAIFSKPIKELLSLETEVDDAALISIDSKGTDVRVRQGAQFNIQRLAFEEGHGVETLEEAKVALWNLIHRGGGLKLEHKI